MRDMPTEQRRTYRCSKKQYVPSGTTKPSAKSAICRSTLLPHRQPAASPATSPSIDSARHALLRLGSERCGGDAGRRATVPAEDGGCGTDTARRCRPRALGLRGDGEVSDSG